MILVFVCVDMKRREGRVEERDVGEGTAGNGKERKDKLGLKVGGVGNRNGREGKTT